MPAIEQRNSNGRPYLRLFKAVIAVSSSCSCWNLLSFLHQGDSFKMVSSKVMKCLSKYSLCWNFPTCTRQHENKTKIAYLKHLSAQMYHGRENFIKSWNYFLIIFLSRSRLVEKYARCIGKTVNTKHTFCLSQTNLCTGKDPYSKVAFDIWRSWEWKLLDIFYFYCQLHRIYSKFYFLIILFLARRLWDIVCYKGMLMAHVQLAAHKDPEVCFCRGKSFPGSGLGNSFCWTSQDSRGSISPGCWGCSERRHKHLVYWPLLPLL